MYGRFVKADLEKVCKKLTDHLKCFVDEHAEEFHLSYGNDSAKMIPFYEMTSRVKNESSLGEKAIRKQEYYRYQVTDSDEKVRDIILSSIPDIIGVRFLTSLQCDTDSLFQLITTYEADLKDEGIVLLNLDANPSKMKNGKKLYKIRGRYLDQYPFELQIKSKIDSAWGDIEHTLFYKDYSFSYVHQTNQQFMNRIGLLLDEADALISLVRSGQMNYEQERESMEFDQILRDRYLGVIRNHLKSAYIIKEYRDSLYAMYQHGSEEQKNYIRKKVGKIPSVTKILCFKAKKEFSQTTMWKQYQLIKETSAELIFLEHIYSDWRAGNKNWVDEAKMMDYLKLVVRCIVEDRVKVEPEDEKIRTAFSKAYYEALMQELRSDHDLARKVLVLFRKKELQRTYENWSADKESEPTLYLN